MPKKLTKLLIVGFMVMSLLVITKYGLYYCLDFWAPTKYENGLVFKERPMVYDAFGKQLSDVETQEFIDICSKLNSTTRDIGEDRGSGFIRMSYPSGSYGDHITVYCDKNIIFHGWWIDAKTHSMVGRRAPCFEISEELEDFMQEHTINNPDA